MLVPGIGIIIPVRLQICACFDYRMRRFGLSCSSLPPGCSGCWKVEGLRRWYRRSFQPSPSNFTQEATSIGMNKADSIAKALAEINSQVEVECIKELVTVENVLDLLKDCDVVVDATDNVVTRYLINDAAAIKKVPLVSGAALGWDGQVSVFPFDSKSPCYRCLYPQPPPASAITNCDLAGVVGPVTGIIGSLQALQVLRILAGLPPACTDSLWLSVARNAPNYSGN